MQFLILRGHTRLVPQGGFAEFPDAVLNAKRLDLFNLYREVSCFIYVKVISTFLSPFCKCCLSKCITGGFKGWLSRWEWHQLERTSFL